MLIDTAYVSMLRSVLFISCQNLTGAVLIFHLHLPWGWTWNASWSEADGHSSKAPRHVGDDGCMHIGRPGWRLTALLVSGTAWAGTAERSGKRVDRVTTDMHLFTGMRYPEETTERRFTRA